MSKDYHPGGIVTSGRSFPVQLEDGDIIFCANGRTVRWRGDLNRFVDLPGDWRRSAAAVVEQLRRIQESREIPESEG